MHRARNLIVLTLAAGAIWIGASRHLLRLNLCHVGHYSWHVSPQPCGVPLEAAPKG